MGSPIVKSGSGLNRGALHDQRHRGAVTVPRVAAIDSARYWDERARENALYFVDNEIG